MSVFDSMVRSFLKFLLAKKLLATLSALVVVAGILLGAQVAVADSVWVQSYQRESSSEACVAQMGETPWQASWGTDSSWKPTWEQWANKGTGGWTCTRGITWAKSPAAGGGACATGGPYVVGGIGPGCGLVFLISGGLTYEMAPNMWGDNETTTIQWCSDASNSVTTSAAVGAGSTNTTAMLTSASPFVACTSSAPNAVRAYAGGGLTDWFLPSQLELQAMYAYSQVGGFNSATYGFANAYYWSSTQFNNSFAEVHQMVNDIANIARKDSGVRVRPIRAF